MNGLRVVEEGESESEKEGVVNVDDNGVLCEELPPPWVLRLRNIFSVTGKVLFVWRL